MRRIRQRRWVFARVAATIGDQLSRPPTDEVVYLIGPAPLEGWRAWALGALPDGWTIGEHYYEGATPVMRYAGPDGPVELHHAASWFTDHDGYTVAEATDAFRLLAAALVREHRGRALFPGAVLLATPASTGRDLWLRKIEPGRQWPVLARDVAELVRESSGQARIEMVSHPHDTIPALFEYDGRLMYAALAAWGLPGGAPTLEAGDRHVYEPYAAARYLVNVKVPRDWSHPFGLLGVKDTNGATWRYPHDPGEEFTTWVDGAELHLAGRCGWSPLIAEALVWPRYTGKGPLASWANALIGLREQLAEPSRVHQLARAAVRNLVLHTIGSLHTSSHTVTRFAPTLQEVPPAFLRVARPEAGQYAYPVELPARWAQMQHPELSAAIWGRVRARLMAGPGRTGALHATGATGATTGSHRNELGSSVVLAFRTDAIYTTHPQNWPDDGAAGRFRLKVHHRGPFPTPRTHADLIHLRRHGGSP